VSLIRTALLVSVSLNVVLWLRWAALRWLLDEECRSAHRHGYREGWAAAEQVYRQRSKAGPQHVVSLN
jgi:hypothetical protein